MMNYNKDFYINAQIIAGKSDQTLSDYQCFKTQINIDNQSTATQSTVLCQKPFYPFLIDVAII